MSGHSRAEEDKVRPYLQGQTAEERYRSAISALLCDGVFDAEDARVLDQYRDYVGLTAEAAADVFRDEARSYIKIKVLGFLEDGTVSPDEDATLDSLIESIGLGPMWGPEIEAALSKGRKTWALAMGPLPVISTDLGLIGSEQAYLQTSARAFEERSKSVGVSYSGLTLTIPIVSGLRYRVGHYGVNRNNLQYQHELGDGDLTVTSDRIIFRFSSGAITTNLRSIIDMTAYRDGISVQKANGKLTTYLLPEVDEDFSLVLWRAWQEARLR
jgi:hypothetical protein